MSGTVEGYKKTRATLIERFGSEEAYNAWRKSISAKGGANSSKSGFYLDREQASRLGKIGGAKSRRPLSAPDKIGTKAYFKQKGGSINGATYEEFVGLYRLGGTYIELSELIGQSKGNVHRYIKGIKLDDGYIL